MKQGNAMTWLQYSIEPSLKDWLQEHDNHEVVLIVNVLQFQCKSCMQFYPLGEEVSVS